MKVDIHNHKLNYNYQFEVPDSGIVGVYGISGSGKSSLLNALAGYESNVKGTMVFNNKSLKGISKCAYMNQNPVLFEHWTVTQNLDFAKHYNQQPYQQLIQSLQCEHLLEKYPPELSGGEKQRIVFIRTLIQINNNSLVLLDEPFSGLDIKIRKKALQILCQYKNCLIFLVTHEIHELYQVADEFIYIKDGIIEHQDTINNTMMSGICNLPVATRVTLNNRVQIIYADDISISLQHNKNSSIQNQIKTKLVSIKKTDDTALLKLALNSGEHLYANITATSLKQLNLETNQNVIANFKAMAYHKFK